jgi:hypothetical protein
MYGSVELRGPLSYLWVDVAALAGQTATGDRWRQAMENGELKGSRCRFD